MTTLLIQSEPTPLTVNFPAIAEMTPQQFYDFCKANRDLRIERTATGKVIIRPLTCSDTGNRSGKVFQQLANWADQDGTGETFDSSTGFTLPNGATRSPDAAWIKVDRWNALTAEQQASFAPICPDFVIELRSANDSLSTLQAKLKEYIDNGTFLGWLIDRTKHTAHIYRTHVRELRSRFQNPRCCFYRGLRAMQEKTDHVREPPGCALLTQICLQYGMLLN